MRAMSLFNDNWLFLPRPADSNVPDADFSSITLPHSNKIFPHHNFHDDEYQFISTYRKRFRLPLLLNGRRLYLDFGGAMLAATVSINGHTFPEYKGGFTPFSFDITDYVREDAENLLVVHLDSTERKDIPPYGYVVDYMTFGGIYRDVHLRYVAPVHITNVHVRTYDVLTDKPRAEVDIFVRNQSDSVFQGSVQALINSGIIAADGNVATLAIDTVPIEIAAQSQEKVTIILADLPQIALWTLDNPVRYGLGVELHQAGTCIDDYGAFPFGFREAVFKDDGFYLNGERLQLRGLNRHQTYAYIGCAAPARLQRKDADIVKFELGCNVVRTSHYPQSPHFLNRCDEIGLLVFEEIPGWQHIGDKDWQAISLRDVRAMIERDWNHPSIILWGVRINESLDNTEFYTATNALARTLDTTRQTGGVRFFPHSEFLEDVYTMNDFYGPLEPTHSPWLITEFHGHMFPTKTFDNEDRRLDHAVRHAKYHARAATMGGIAGAIAWCAFDYNTHKEFGSGDRICYHGVSDIFRLPKWAAHFYASQQAPTQRIVLQAASLWSMGDRSEGGNNPLYVFSNCDTIEVFAGTERIGEFKPNHDEFPNIPHPPFKVTGLGMRWGEEFGDLRVVGYLAGKAVAEQNIACDGHPTQLVLALDDDVIAADGADMTRLIFKVVDRYGNPLPYATPIVNFEISGDAELIGENPFALVGGQAALYVKARHTAGTVVIRASTKRLPDAEITLTIA